MPDLKDTYVVHKAMVTCSMGMRASYVVLPKSHGVFLRGQAQLTVEDCKPETNLICFGGCYSVENPSTLEAMESIQEQIAEESPDTFIDKVMNFFGGNKKKEAKQGDPTSATLDTPMVVGECKAVLVSGQSWDRGKEGVETGEKKPLLGEARLFCMYGGEIKLEDAGQPEAGE